MVSLRDINQIVHQFVDTNSFYILPLRFYFEIYGTNKKITRAHRRWYG